MRSAAVRAAVARAVSGAAVVCVIAAAAAAACAPGAPRSSAATDSASDSAAVPGRASVPATAGSAAMSTPPAPSPDTAHGRGSGDTVAPRRPATPPQTAREAQGGLAVTLERRPCHGTCPVYRVSVRELSDGRAAVRWDGGRNVARVGAASDTVSRAALGRIAAAVERADYFSLPARYAYQEPTCPSYATDAPMAVTTVRRGARTHRVEHDYGCAGVPEALTALEAAIDSAAGTGRWVGAR